jgi:hypothetical protein
MQKKHLDWFCIDKRKKTKNKNKTTIKHVSLAVFLLGKCTKGNKINYYQPSLG